MKKLFSIFISTNFLYFSFLSREVLAQSYLPPFFQQFLDAGADRSGAFTTSRVQIMLLLFLGTLIIVAVFYAISSGWKYIRAQGDQTQIDEATKAIQAIFMGLGTMLVSIVGLVLVFIFFGNNLFGAGILQSCEYSYKNVGCMACNRIDGGLPDNWSGELKFEDNNPELEAGRLVSKGASFGPNTEISSQQICTFCEWEFYHADGGEFPNEEIAKFICTE